MKRTNLIKARSEAGFTQKSLAREIGMTLDHVKSLEYGRVNPSLETAAKISKALKKKPEYLFSDVLSIP